MAKAHLLGIWRDFKEAPSIEVVIYTSSWFFWLGWLLKRIIWICAYKEENRDKVIAGLRKSTKGGNC